MAVRKKCPIRSLLLTHMADYTNNGSAPRNITGGYYALHITDIGKIWYAKTSSFSSTIQRYKNRAAMATCVMDAFARGAKVELWLLTQPERFDGERFHAVLDAARLLADRKPRTMEGPGRLYCVQHRVTHDYFVVSDRTGVAESTLLSGFLTRLQLIDAASRNKALGEFVTTNAEDIIKGMNFEIIEIDRFDDNEDKWLRRQCYIDSRKHGNNLNLNSVE